MVDLQPTIHRPSSSSFIQDPREELKNLRKYSLPYTMVAIESVKELAELARHLYYEGSFSSSSILNLEEEKFDFSLRVPV